ncbi:hypothetical protein E4U53_007804, partial [Claviceps sorghi]
MFTTMKPDQSGLEVLKCADDPVSYNKKNHRACLRCREQKDMVRQTPSMVRQTPSMDGYHDPFWNATAAVVLFAFVASVPSVYQATEGAMCAWSLRISSWRFTMDCFSSVVAELPTYSGQLFLTICIEKAQAALFLTFISLADELFGGQTHIHTFLTNYGLRKDRPTDDQFSGILNTRAT